MIQQGDRVPEATLYEYVHEASEGCSIGPAPVSVTGALAGKRVLVFGLPGAYTPTCSASHVPGYLRLREALGGKGIDEVWCLSVNDAFVMGAWGKDQGVGQQIRMMADGSGELTRAMGLEFDLSGRGLGVRCQRFAMVVRDGVVEQIAVEAPGKFEVSSAEAMLARL